MLYRTALIPERNSPYGPVTAARRRRLWCVYGLMFALGLGLALVSGSARATAFGLGLMLPGGGFVLYAAGHFPHAIMHLALVLGTWAAFGVSLVAWFGSGNVIAPVLVWLGAAVWAAAMTHGQLWRGAVLAVPSLVLLMAAAERLGVRRQFAAARALGRRRNAYLEHTNAVATPLTGERLPLVEELSREDVSALRFLLDRALQPVEQFNGYSWIEQFQTSSMRYQLMMTSYMLSLTQATRMPAFRGYLSQAQLNLIEKTKLPEVWRYWLAENALGNLRLGGDPMAPDTHDNVMYSGWFAAMVGMYASNTGDARYAAPGSITLREKSGREYVYDWPTVVHMLADNFQRSEFTLFPCEPNWIYPLCNTYAGIGLRIHDRVRGSEYWARLEDAYRRGLEHEFTRADGRLVMIRSSLTGLGVPALSSVMTDAGVAVFQHALLPDIARRSWEIVRHDLLALRDGELAIHYHGSDFLDVGNYKFSRAGTLACVASLAAEMGDRELVQAARALFEAKYPPIVEHGTTRYAGLSVNTHLLAFGARVNRANGLLDLVAHGPPEPWRTGPLLDEAAYPHVLIAKAVSDGRALEIVAYPGHEPGVRALGLTQLVPHQRYRCQGALEPEIQADAEGRAHVRVDLRGRHELAILPTP